MKRIAFFILFFGLYSSISAGNGGNKKEKEHQTRVLIHTDLGDIKILLYNETPKHRDNFIKLVKEGTLNNTLFHRVIEGFMIQGGDPDSKNAPVGTMLGNGSLGHTIPAEINPLLFHKKGALAAARLGDDVNPNKESSDCQFYIVHGRVFSDTLLSIEEMQMKQAMMQQIFNEYISKPENLGFRDQFIRLNRERKLDSMQILSLQVQPFIDSELVTRNPHKFSPEQRKIYSTIGGAPHLDGGYTVFGEVYEGLDVVDKIATVEKDQNDRPKTDIHMTFSLIKK
jgi:peptidylprolyl isomerase